MFTRRFSIIGFCSGIISGLVGITPACGFVPVSTAALIGALTSCASFFTVRYKYLLRIDEGLDIFAIHGVGGFVGDIMTGFFAAPYVPAMDGVSNFYQGGWWARNWIQMGYQLAAATTCAAWSFVISIILLFIINRIPGCHIRATEDDELRGLDYKYFSDAEGDMMVLTGYGAATPGLAASQVASGSQSHQDVPVTTEKRD
jgi:Amt family ammonium transporter